MSLESLIERFVDDREQLAPEELDALVEGLRADPARAAELREQLVIDDLVAQKLAVDRRNFLAQVEQRIADFQRTQAEIDDQVSDLRALAEAEIQHPPRPVADARWAWYSLAISAVLLIGAFLIVPRVLSSRRAVAKVIGIEGEVRVGWGEGVSQPVMGGAVLNHSYINVHEGSSLAVQYADGTQVRLNGGTQANLEEAEDSGGKLVRVSKGEVAATVAPQPGAGMRFLTPHAVATVLGTALRITVDDHSTTLDVTQGTVQFDHRDGGKPVLVEKNGSCVASEDELKLRELRWPDEQREALAFLFNPFVRQTFVRNAESGNPRETELVPRDAAILDDFHHALDLAGGSFVLSTEPPDNAAALLFEQFRESADFSLEIVLQPAAGSQQGKVLTLADSGAAANVVLAQDGEEFIFAIKTEQQPTPPALRLGKIASDRPTHLTITYQSGELIAYCDGVETVRSREVTGKLAWHPGPLAVGGDAGGQSPWRGTVEGIALFKTRLAPSDVARNVRSYRVLAGRAGL
ncbi:MAG: FecR domain-containing protein [Pirellulaceae bacterium]|nr:FecR domain-containing protein [Pirellulaceae bacterium]